MARQQIDFPVQQHQIATPSSPPSGAMKLYPKVDGKFYSLSSAGVEKPMGAEDPLVVNNATVNQTLTIGSSGRIKGDFSNATAANRTLFQTSTANTYTATGLLPSGTGVGAYFDLYSGSDPANSSILSLHNTGTYTSLASHGTYIPLTFQAHGTERGRLNADSSAWSAPYSVRINCGVYYDGGAWNRYDTSALLTHINVGNGDFNIYTAAAGTGVPGWVNRFQITTAGTINISGTLNANSTAVISGQLQTMSKLLVYGTEAQAISYGGPLINEVQTPGGGAAGFSFHRPGYYALNFGLDTDNQLKVGGWSMGGVAYKILDTRDQAIEYNVDVGVKRWAGGNIQCLAIYMPSGAQGGTPSYILAQNGDGWARWYPKASVSGCSAVGAGTGGTGGLPGWPSTSGDLGAVYAPRTGYAHVSCIINSNGDDAAIHIFRNGALALQGSSANGGQNTTFAVHGNFYVNVNDYISVRASGDGNSGLGGGYLLVTVGTP